MLNNVLLATEVEMIGARDSDSHFRFRYRVHKFLKFLRRADEVPVTTNQELRPRLPLKETEVVFVHRRSNADEPARPRVIRGGLESDPASERIACEHNPSRVRFLEPVDEIERSPYVVYFAIAVVMLALAPTGPPEIEPEAYDAPSEEAVLDSLGHVIPHVPAIERVRMADHRGGRGKRHIVRYFQDTFQDNGPARERYVATGHDNLFPPTGSADRALP